MRRPRINVVIVVCAGLLAAGCGSGDDAQVSGARLDAVLAAVDGLPAAERLAPLQKLAEAEGGQLSLYTSLTGSIVQDIVDAFEDATGVDVALYRASSETVEQRLLEEADAGYHGADVVDTTSQSLLVVGESDLLVAYPFDRAPLLDGTVHDGWAATRLQRLVVAWNTDRVGRPASWEALGLPAAKGRVSIETGDWDWYSRLSTYLVEERGASPDEADALFERIARNAKVISGHSLGAQLLATGEVDVLIPAYSHHIDRLAAKGAPVAWAPVLEPGILRQDGVAVLASARHPAAAALFAEWALGPGQAAYREAGYRSSRRDAKQQDSAFRTIDEERLAEERDRWVKGWERLVTLAAPTSG